MSQFSGHREQLVAMVSEGLPLTEACSRVGVSYNTVRNWVSAGRSNPSGDYGAFVAALDRGRMAGIENDDPGPVEREVQSLLAGRELEGEATVTAAQARALARKVDALAGAPGGSAGLALASVSRRLEDCVAQLRLEKKDFVDELREQVQRRRQLFQQGDQSDDR
jgi:hypothetical protein